MTNVTNIQAHKDFHKPSLVDPRLAHRPEYAGRPVRGGGIAGQGEYAPKGAPPAPPAPAVQAEDATVEGVGEVTEPEEEEQDG